MTWPEFIVYRLDTDPDLPRAKSSKPEPLRTLFEDAYLAQGELFRSNFCKRPPRGLTMSFSVMHGVVERLVRQVTAIKTLKIMKTRRDGSGLGTFPNPETEMGAREEETQDGRLTLKLFMDIIHH